MIEEKQKNPAELAAEKTIIEIYKCLDNRKSFLLEAGAGAGKTYSLIQALKYLVEKHGDLLLRKSQQIACITYTNVASSEIQRRVDGHPAVLFSTIHAFCWSLIKDFQSQLRQKLRQLPKLEEMLREANVDIPKRIEYDLGYRKIDDDKISLSHNDVIFLTNIFMENIKFRKILISRYPIIFVDEYQDTNKQFAESLLTYFIDAKDSNLVVGFFGDGWQKIYDDVCGSISSGNLTYIHKGANFRSDKAIVEVLNRIRPELKQAVKDPNSTGYVKVFHTNDWKGERLKGNQWKGDLPPDIAHSRLEFTKDYLLKDGWEFTPEKTKILMLTHNVLAKEQGYSGISNVFRGRNDDFIKQEDPYINFLVNTLEPICSAFENNQYGDMFKLLDKNTPTISSINDKRKWEEDMRSLLHLRSNGTIGEVLDHLKKTNRPRLSSILQRKEKELLEYNLSNDCKEDPSMERHLKLKSIPYKEIVALKRYIDEKTPFSTKHGVKGAEFENVLVVFGRGWNRYDFNKFLEYSNDVTKIQ